MRASISLWFSLILESLSPLMTPCLKPGSVPALAWLTHSLSYFIIPVYWPPPSQQCPCPSTWVPGKYLTYEIIYQHENFPPPKIKDANLCDKPYMIVGVVLMLRSYSQLVLDLSVKMPLANCWVEGIRRTFGPSRQAGRHRGEERCLPCFGRRKANQPYDILAEQPWTTSPGGGWGCWAGTEGGWVQI